MYILNRHTTYGEKQIALAEGTAFNPVLPVRSTSYYNIILFANFKRKKSLITHQRVYTYIFSFYQHLLTLIIGQ